MQEEKKNKIKSFLTKLLVVLVLVVISISTYKVNLSVMLHDFVLRFFDAAMSNDDGKDDENDKDSNKDDSKNNNDSEERNTDDNADDENSEDSNNDEKKSESSIFKLFGNVTVEAAEKDADLLKSVTDIICNENSEYKSGSLSDSLEKTEELSDDEKSYFSEWLSDYRKIRQNSNVIEINAGKQDAFKNLNDTLYSKQVQRSVYLMQNYKDAGMNIESAECYYQIADIIKEEQQYEIIMYEWTVVNYSMNNNKDSMGYGIWHTLVMENGEIVEDEYTGDIYGDDEETSENTSVMSYNPSAAVDYSNKYALNYNSSYSNYNSIGGDCANFVSQCLYAGGLNMTDGWYWKSYDDRSASWSYCPSQVEYLSKNCGTLVEDPANSKVLKGNPVYYYSAVKNRYSHAAICVGTNSDGVAIVNAHNNDRYHVPWQLGSSWSKRSTILISGANSDATPPVISNIKITQKTNQGFKLTADVSDNAGLDSVYFPVWTEKNGQDDIVWHKASVSGRTATCYINVSSHKYEGGTYIINVYAYDTSGNESSAYGGEVSINRSVPYGTLAGDATLDGKVNLADALYVLKLALGIYSTDDIKAADYDGNGVVNLIDAVKILNVSLGISH